MHKCNCDNTYTYVYEIILFPYFCGLSFSIACFISMATTAALKWHYRFSPSLHVVVRLQPASVFCYGNLSGRSVCKRPTQFMYYTIQWMWNQPNLHKKLLTIVKRGDFASQSSLGAVSGGWLTGLQWGMGVQGAIKNYMLCYPQSQIDVQTSDLTSVRVNDKLASSTQEMQYNKIQAIVYEISVG